MQVQASSGFDSSEDPLLLCWLFVREQRGVLDALADRGFEGKSLGRAQFREEG